VEYQESLSLAPKELEPRLNLALAQEKKGDWVAALSNYHQAALDEEPPKIGAAQIRYDAQNKYQSAQQRFQQHLADLRSSGSSAKAAYLESRLRAREATPNVDAKYHDALQASMQAAQERKFDQAETAAKQAIAIAEKIQPLDGRLPESVGQLGSVYAWRMDYKQAGENYQRQLILAEKVFGPQSPMITTALQNLALLALAQKDFANAETYFTRSYDLDQKTFGENSQGAADSLRGLAHVYSMKQDFAKSESSLLRVAKIYETIYGPDDNRLAIPWTSLCAVYDQWGKAEKSASCHAHLVAIAEKQFGPDSPYLVRELTAEAQAWPCR